MTITSYLTSPVIYSTYDLNSVIVPFFSEFNGYIPLRPFIYQQRVRLDITHTSARFIPAAGYVQKWRYGILYIDTSPILIFRQAEEQDPYPTIFLTPSYTLELYHSLIKYLQGFYSTDPPTGDFHIEMEWSNTLPPPLSFMPPKDQTAKWNQTIEYAKSTYKIPQAFI
jgi:hypothetical protein